MLLESALSGGVDLIQLRDKEAGDERLVGAAAVFREAADRHGVPFLINDRPELVARVGADGVHVGQEDTPVAEARALAGSRRDRRPLDPCAGPARRRARGERGREARLPERRPGPGDADEGRAPRRRDRLRPPRGRRGDAPLVRDRRDRPRQRRRGSRRRREADRRRAGDRRRRGTRGCGAGPSRRHRRISEGGGAVSSRERKRAERRKRKMRSAESSTVDAETAATNGVGRDGRGRRGRGGGARDQPIGAEERAGSGRARAARGGRAALRRHGRSGRLGPDRSQHPDRLDRGSRGRRRQRRRQRAPERLPGLPAGDPLRGDGLGHVALPLLGGARLRGDHGDHHGRLVHHARSPRQASSRRSPRPRS